MFLTYSSILKTIKIVRVSGVIGFLSITLLFSKPVFAQQKIVISTFENSGIESIYLPILQAAYRKLDMQLFVKHAPPERSLFESNLGRVDGEAARLVAIEKKANNLIRVPTPLGAINTHAFSKSLDTPITSWDSLKPYTIIVLLGYKHAEKMSRGIRRIFAHNPEQAMMLLHKGKADFAVLPLLDGLAALKTQNLTSITVQSSPIESNQLYHYLHREKAHLAPKLNKVLKGMELAGDLEMYRRQAIEKYAAKSSLHQLITSNENSH